MSSSGSNGGLSGSGLSQVPLKRTRSGSRLVPVDGAGSTGATGLVSHGFSVENNPAGGGPGGRLGGGMFAQPPIQRTNTSFFRDLVSSDLFSPGSRDMFQAWADSPRGEAPDFVAAAVSDTAAPPSLRRVASNDAGGLMDPPKLTRSLTSYLKEMSGEAPPAPSPQIRPTGAGAEPAAFSRQVSFGLDRQPSENPMPFLGRSMTSFVRDFVDTSAELESAPPANAVPPSLRLSTSQHSLDPLDLGFDYNAGASAGAGLSSLGQGAGSFGGPPPLSRRSSPRVSGVVSPFLQ